MICNHEFDYFREVIDYDCDYIVFSMNVIDYDYEFAIVIVIVPTIAITDYDYPMPGPHYKSSLSTYTSHNQQYIQYSGNSLSHNNPHVYLVHLLARAPETRLTHYLVARPGATVDGATYIMRSRRRPNIRQRWPDTTIHVPATPWPSSPTTQKGHNRYTYIIITSQMFVF